MSTARTARYRDEAGISMVELIVFLAVAGLLLSIVATLFATSLNAQRQTADRNDATAQLNAATASITESVRASAEATVSESSRRLDAAVLLADGETWECRAWHVQGGELVYRTTRAGVSSSWTALASGVRGNLPAGAAFAGEASRITLGLTNTRRETEVAVTDGSYSQVFTEAVPSC